MKECFKPINNFPDYVVGDLGTIKSLKFGKERMLKKSIGKHGYQVVTLIQNGKQQNYRVNRLVAIHHIPNPENLPQVNHKDGDKTNNAKSNLEWVTGLQNMKHAYETGLVNRDGLNNPNAKLTPEQVQQIRNLKGQKTQKEIGLMFGICQSYVGDIHKGNNWKK